MRWKNENHYFPGKENECGYRQSALEGFARISYAYSLERLKKAMERIARFIKWLEAGEPEE